MSHPKDGLDLPTASTYATVFAIAAATLTLQLVQTRIYSVVFWNHMVYFIISVALLGFGISGAWLAVASEARFFRRLSPGVAAGLFGLTALMSCLLVPRFSVSLGSIASRAWMDVSLFSAYLCAVLPYFFGGWMLGGIFQRHARFIDRLYFVDLLGAGIGCLAFVLLIQPLGAPRLAVLTALGPAIAALSLDRPRGAVLLNATLATTCAVCWIQADRINEAISPEPTKAFHNLYAENDPSEIRTELSEWNTISRVDVRSTAGNPDEKRVFIDGDAWTQFIPAAWVSSAGFDPDAEPLTTHKVPFFFRREIDSALVIGFGGGVDVWMALRGGAEHVDAIEINPTTYRAGLREYYDFTGGLLQRPSVHAHNEEGRSFVRRGDTRYDLVILHGIDTFAALNAGAYVLSENYLYTVEAIEDYLRTLQPGGMVSITRWVHYAETPRLFAVCLEALERMGYAEPERHIVLHGREGGTILLRTDPFTDSEVQSFARHLAKWDGTLIYPALPDTAGSPERETVVDYVEARRAGDVEKYLRTLPFNISPVYDDSPFFFHFDQARNLWRVFREQGVADLVRGHWPSFTLFTLLGLAVLATLAFVLAPLSRLSRADFPGFVPWTLYFCCLGLGFIFVEIALMQRFALLLGHPARSLACVLATLLVSTGIGSALSRNGIRPAVTFALTLGLLGLVAFGYSWVAGAALAYPLPLRALVVIALTCPVGILLGMPFPRGIHALADSPNAVAWMWGVNGGATVVGSVLAIVVAIWSSFTVLLLCAAGLYATAYVAWRAATR